MIIAIDVDPQKTFSELCPQELPIPNATQIVSALNEQAKLAQKRVGTKDAHSLSASWIQKNFASDEFCDQYWPAHAIVGTAGFEYLPGLPQPHEYDFFVWKGIEPSYHPYGACYHDLQEKLSTGLLEWLRAQNTKTLIIGGLALDYCVKTTITQLKRAGDWQIILNLAATKALNEEKIPELIEYFQAQGVIVVENTAALKNHLEIN